MKTAVSRTAVVAFLMVTAVSLALVAGCAGGTQGATTGASGSATSTPDGSTTIVKIGALPNEDSLPLWVATQEGYFKKAGLDVQITTFPSAAERDAALQAGSVDMVSGDILAAALLADHGFPVKIATLQLGATPAEGRFGILANPKSGLTKLSDLAAKGALAQSSGTLAAYSADQMLRQAGVDPAKVKRVEVKKLPVRFELLNSNKVPSAVLPEPLLSLGQKQGLTLLAVDTKGPENISQTVLIVSDKWLNKDGSKATMDTLLGVTDHAAAAINASPDAYRQLLVDKARLPEAIAKEYQISHYPAAQVPAQQQVDAVLTWMRAAKLISEGDKVTYDSLVFQRGQ